MSLLLGKKPARSNAVQMRFGSYYGAAVLPSVPEVIGVPGRVRLWGMLGNDIAADCVQASASHATMLFATDTRRDIPKFTTGTTLADYRAVNPDDPKYENGTDMQQYAAYRQKIGIRDALGNRHKIDYYAALRPGDLNQLALAVYWFGAVDIGLLLPDNAEEQFDHFEPWDSSVPNPSRGHCVPVVGRNSKGLWIVVTWGRLQGVTGQMLSACMDEGIVAMSRERITDKGLSPLGLNVAALQDDYVRLTS